MWVAWQRTARKKMPFSSKIPIELPLLHLSIINLKLKEKASRERQPCFSSGKHYGERKGQFFRVLFCRMQQPDKLWPKEFSSYPSLISCLYYNLFYIVEKIHILQHVDILMQYFCEPKHILTTNLLLFLTAGSF